MTAWNLGLNSIEKLVNLPETGMGFQLVSALWRGESAVLIVLNAELAFDLSQVELLAGTDPAVILTNGIRVLDAMRQGGPTIVGRPEPHSFNLLESRVGGPGMIPMATATTARTSSPIAQPSSLVKNVMLSANRIFHRYSAFNPDNRVDPVTGNFAPGTYTVPESEVPFIPTGFAAVGRLALPNLLPASHHYVLEAPSGTPVSFGTVAPAFGQAGGGVEALLPNGATNQQVPLIPPSMISDE
jgi:hypothetical protein